MGAAHYTIGEVVFLTSLSEEQARWFDSDAVSWLGRMSPDPVHGGGDSSGPRLPVIVRWHDVQRARRLVNSRRDHELLRLRAEEQLSVVEAAEVLGISERHARRRLRSVNELILDELGGAEPQSVKDAQFDRLTDLVERVLRGVGGPLQMSAGDP